MNIFINGFFEKFQLQIALNLLQSRRINDLYLTYFEQEPNFNKACKKVTYLSYEKALWANYEIDWNQFKPLDANIISQMTHCEMIFLKMMDRCESKGFLSYSQRKSLYLKHLRYWNHMICQGQLDLYIGANIPHEGYDYVAYCLCKLYKINTLIFFQGPIEDTVFLTEDWQAWNEIKNAYYNLCISDQSSIPVDVSSVTLTSRFQSHYEVQTERGKDPIPFYMNPKPLFLKQQVNDVLGSLENMNLKIFINQTKGKIKSFIKERLFDKKHNIFKEYKKLSQLPDLSKKYIYVALHYQPECTTSPMADVFVDQILSVQMLSSVLPEDVYLYVKDHPMQEKVGRDREFYQELKQIKNVFLIPRDFNSFRILENSIAVATATGTVGWEALFRDKPVLMFGFNFYQNAPNVFQIQTIEQCKTAIHKILMKSEDEFNLNQTRIFLKAIEQSSIKGYIDSAYEAISKISEQENIQNISEALIQAVITLQAESDSNKEMNLLEINETASF
jgi:hypothetical protein